MGAKNSNRVLCWRYRTDSVLLFLYFYVRYPFVLLRSFLHSLSILYKDKRGISFSYCFLNLNYILS